MREHNPFLECEAFKSEHGTGWGVRSRYWNIPAENEMVARRIEQIIRSAYFSGQADTQNKIKEALGL